jgi:hypothetical protein
MTVKRLSFVALWLALSVSGCALQASSSEQPAPALTAVEPQTADAMLPNRKLDCVLRRATNIDTKKTQTIADVIYEGHHPFSLFLPAIPARTGPPPEAIDAPEPVNPATKILLDPDGLTKNFPNRFDRVVDYWPQRVEMTTTINDPLVNLIIISDFDQTSGTANLFMTQATDVATFDMQHIYQGICKVTVGKA